MAPSYVSSPYVSANRVCDGDSARDARTSASESGSVKSPERSLCASEASYAGSIARRASSAESESEEVEEGAGARTARARTLRRAPPRPPDTATLAT